MKLRILPLLAALVLLGGCALPPLETAPETAPETTAAPTTVPTEAPTRPTGWQEADGLKYYLYPDGTHPTGWFEDRGETYYIAPNGFAQTGWLLLDGQTYYFREDGVMVTGEVEIDGAIHHFTSTGAKILVVNPWNYLPEDYEPDLKALPANLSSNNQKVDASCYDDLVAMLEACNAESPRACVVSSYRTQEYQEKLYKRKVSRVEAQGYSYEDALVEAAKVVAIPGTSEHQTGLAVDIVDSRDWSLTEKQATYPAQQWLMAHCWEYGFILRYPADKTNVTGIIYEPWHYRYVGKALSKELHDLGLTLEEYLINLSDAVG